MMKIWAEVEIDIGELARSHTTSGGDALEMIRQIDLGFADMDFTEQVLIMLCNSLSVDLCDEEKKVLLGVMETALNKKSVKKRGRK